MYLRKNNIREDFFQRIIKAIPIPVYIGAPEDDEQRLTLYRVYSSKLKRVNDECFEITDRLGSI